MRVVSEWVTETWIRHWNLGPRLTDGEERDGGPTRSTVKLSDPIINLIKMVNAALSDVLFRVITGEQTEQYIQMGRFGARWDVILSDFRRFPNHTAWISSGMASGHCLYLSSSGIHSFSFIDVFAVSCP